MNTRRKLPSHRKSEGSSSARSPSEIEIFVGLDVSLTDTGLSIIDQDENIIHVESIQTKAGTLDHTRVCFIAKTAVERVLTYAGDHKVRVFIEAIPFSRRPTGKSFTRTEIVGNIKFMLTNAGIDTYLIGATTLKSKFTGKGKADKDDIKKAVLKRFNRVVANENIADALAAAAIGVDYTHNKLKLSIEKLPM